MKRWIFTIAFLLSTVSNWAGTIFLDDETQSYNLNPYVEIYIDKDGKYIEFDPGLYKIPFSMPLDIEDKLSFGFSNYAWWVRFNIANTYRTAQSWLLELSYPLLDRVQLYVAENGKIIKSSMSGDSIPFNYREIEHSNFLFKLDIPEETTLDIFIRVETTGSMKFPLTLWQSETFLQSTAKNSIFQGIYIGIMSVMFCYSLLMFLSIGNKLLLFYALFDICLLLYELTFSGIAFQYIWPKFNNLNNIMLPLIMCLGMFWTLLLSQNYLELKSKYPIINRLIIGIGASTIILIPFIFIIPYSISIQFVMLLVMLTGASVIVISLLCYKWGNRSALDYFLAWAIFLSGAVAAVLQSVGIIPANALTENSLLIGAAISVMLLPIYISRRINSLKQENYITQMKALDTQKKLTHAYQRFVPNELLSLLNKSSILDVNLGDQVEKTMTVLFSDINSFTAHSENMSPQENFNFINAYLKKVAPLVRQFNGFIDKYIGDAIMALFANSTDNTIKAAIEMHRMLIEYNDSLPDKQAINICIGINTGSLMFGTVGEDARMEGTVISDAVNIASRLVSFGKRINSKILISKASFDSLEYPEEFSCRFIGHEQIKGKKRTVDLYEICDVDKEEIRIGKMEVANTLSKGIEHFLQKDIETAATRFKECIEIAPQDNVSQIYYAKCMKYLGNKI